MWTVGHYDLIFQQWVGYQLFWYWPKYSEWNLGLLACMEIVEDCSYQIVTLWSWASGTINLMHVIEIFAILWTQVALVLCACVEYLWGLVIWRNGYYYYCYYYYFSFESLMLSEISTFRSMMALACPICNVFWLLIQKVMTRYYVLPIYWRLGFVYLIELVLHCIPCSWLTILT